MKVDKTSSILECQTRTCDHTFPTQTRHSLRTEVRRVVSRSAAEGKSDMLSCHPRTPPHTRGGVGVGVTDNPDGQSPGPGSPRKVGEEEIRTPFGRWEGGPLHRFPEILCTSPPQHMLRTTCRPPEPLLLAGQ